jgi:hypothetical protein
MKGKGQDLALPDHEVEGRIPKPCVAPQVAAADDRLGGELLVVDQENRIARWVLASIAPCNSHRIERVCPLKKCQYLGK